MYGNNYFLAPLVFPGKFATKKRRKTKSRKAQAIDNLNQRQNRIPKSIGSPRIIKLKIRNTETKLTRIKLKEADFVSFDV